MSRSRGPDILNKGCDNLEANGEAPSGALIAGFAAYCENVLMMLAAFVIVCGFRLYEERFQSRWLPLWQSIIEKYENAIHVVDNSGATDSGQGTQT